MKKFLLTIVLVLFAGQAWGATYYVDSVSGNDTAPSPTPAGSPTNGPWKTINKTNASIKNGGDQILFRRGQTFDDALISFWTSNATPENKG